MKDSSDLPELQTKPHVQIYAIMNEHREYDLVDQGELEVITDEGEETMMHYLEVQAGGNTLMRSRLRLENNYEKQKGSVICWTDNEQPEFEDLAVSFQSDEECDFYWRIICERVGKNYLDISARESLEPPNEDNLVDILDKARTNKDLIHYHIINSPHFIAGLLQLFRLFQQRADSMGMGIVTRIVKTILSYIDLKLMETLMADPAFALLLLIEQYTTSINFPRIYQDGPQLRSLLGLPEQIRQKILVIHRATFYRECVLDLSRDVVLENVLVMLIKECYVDILHHLAKEGIFEGLIRGHLITVTQSLIAHSQELSSKDDVDRAHLTQNNIVEEVLADKFIDHKRNQGDICQTNPQTGTSYWYKDAKNGKGDFGGRHCVDLESVNQYKIESVNQYKIEFLLECFSVYKQVTSDKSKARFLERVYQSGLLKHLENLLHQGHQRALQTLMCVAESNPYKLMDYLRNNFRQCPSSNLHLKLSKYYCQENETLPLLILELVKLLAVTFEKKEYLEFFNGTFLCYVLEFCPQEHRLFELLLYILESVKCTETVLDSLVRNKFLSKAMGRLRGKALSKPKELNVIKFLKMLLVCAARGQCRGSLDGKFSGRVSVQAIETGYFDFCMQILAKNIRKNNVLSSAMLECLSIIEKMQFSEYHAHIAEAFQFRDELMRWLQPILTTKGETQEKEQGRKGGGDYHRSMLENEELEDYLMGDNAENDGNTGDSSSAEKDLLKELKQISEEIGTQQAGDGMAFEPKPAGITFALQLVFDEEIQETQQADGSAGMIE